MNKAWTTFALALLLVAVGVRAQTDAPEGPGAPPVPQLGPDQLRAVYFEALATSDGFFYTVDFARFDDCADARKLLAQLDTPPFRLRPLRQATKARRYPNRPLYAMEPELREQVRLLDPRERTGVVKLAAGGCIVAEVVERTPQAVPPFAQIERQLSAVVARGWLPHPDQLAQDPALRARTLANRMRKVADLEAAPGGFDFNTRLSDGYTLLTRALILDEPDVARALLKRGADPKLCAPRNCALTLAIGMRDEQQAWEMTELLLQAGADPNQFDVERRSRTLPLAAAAWSRSVRFAERLVRAGAKVDGIPQASPPLFFAAARGDQEMVEYLLAHGADGFATDKSRPRGLASTPFVAARESKNPQFIAWMEKRLMEIAEKSGKYKHEAWIEQAGKRLPAKDGEVRLKRAPFRVVARLPDGAVGLLVASAQSPAFQEDMRTKNAESALFRVGTVGAEQADGTSDWLYVLAADASTKTGTLQLWSWQSDDDRRFTGRRNAGGATEYYKDIRTFMLADANAKTQDIPVAKYRGGDVYVVLAPPVYLGGLEHRFLGASYLRLKFQ